MVMMQIEFSVHVLRNHFPSSMAKAIVRAAKDHALPHGNALRRKYAACGIASKVVANVRIGSAYYIFDDERLKNSCR